MKTIVGLFDDRAHANSAASQLEAAGVAHNDISFLANNEDRSYGDIPAHSGHSDTLVHHTLKDAEWGVGIGGTLGLLAGASLFVIPGFGWLAGAGWLAGLLSGAAVGGLVGGLVGALVHIGVPETDAAYYNEGVRRGGSLLAVRAEDSQATRVAQILDAAGAVDIDQRGAMYRSEGFVPASSGMAAGAVSSYDNAPAGMTSSSPTLVDSTSRSRYYNYNAPAPLIDNGIPGVQTGGTNRDGSMDTRGITEKIADTVTGDRIDDKTGAVTR